MAKDKEQILQNEFKIDARTSEYRFQVKRKHSLWWLLLLLLPLLLLVKCERTITVVCVDADSKKPVEGAEVKLSYTSYFLYDNNGFFSQYDLEYELVTDDKGEARFSDLKCSVFSYVFHARSKMRIEVSHECYEGDNEECLFHWRRKVKVMMKQKTGLPVHVVDRGTLDGLEHAKVRWRYNGESEASLVTDRDGYGTMPDVPSCSGVIARIDASAEGYYDTTYYNVNIEELEKGEALIKMRPKDEKFHVDMVMCIDNTSSMRDLIGLVKQNALNFPADLTACCAKRGKKLEDFRLRVISFGDLEELSITESGFMEIPSESSRFKDFVSGIRISHGLDYPEDALEALAMAINSDWQEGSTRCRHIIIVYTDATTHKLGHNKGSKFYPKEPMPKDFDELTQWWNGIDSKESRLILFAPDDEKLFSGLWDLDKPRKEEQFWHRIDSEWQNTYRMSLDEVLKSSSGYNEILEAISKSL